MFGDRILSSERSESGGRFVTEYPLVSANKTTFKLKSVDILHNIIGYVVSLNYEIK